MKTRNHMLPVTDHEGRWTEARDMACPCRPCYHPHDMRRPLGMMCLTREQGGCPHPEGTTTVAPPLHVRRTAGAKLCTRCRQRIGDEACAIVP